MRACCGIRLLVVFISGEARRCLFFSPLSRFVTRRASTGSTLGRHLVISPIAFLHNHMLSVGASKLASGINAADEVGLLG